MNGNRSMVKPITLYGSNISYFTGKMENYFRVRGIPYQLKSMQFPAFKKRMEAEVGLHQMPAVILPDGRWMTDTTKMIQWFESQFPENKIIPDDPVQAFLCLLIEDWADEWWWRAAMHYRWDYSEGADFASRHLAIELLGSVAAPIWVKKIFLKYRQRKGYTIGDGVTSQNAEQIEVDFKMLLENLEKIFAQRRFLLGERPSLADIGLAGPFFRHFALDPVPAEILKKDSPQVLNWVSRLWSTKISDCPEKLMISAPDDLEPLFQQIGSTYLPYLCANVDAVSANKKRFEFEVGGISFKGARYSKYRVWCLKELRHNYKILPKKEKEVVRRLLKKTGCWEPLWRQSELPLSKNQDNLLPFKGHTKMVGVYEAKNT